MRTAFPDGGAKEIKCVNPLADSRGLNPAEIAGASVFHTAEWLLTLQESYGFQPCCFLRDTGAGREYWPFLEVQSRLTGKRGISLPFTDFCYPILRRPDSPKDFWETILRHAERAGWKYLEIRGGQPIAENAPPAATYLLHYLPLKSNPAEMWRGLSKNHRRNIRRAEKSGMKIIRGVTADLLEDFYHLNQLTRRRHGLPPQPVGFFKNLHQNLLNGETGEIFIAYRQKQPVAGAVYLQHDGRVIYKYGASYPEAAFTGANHLVMWQALQHYGASGRSDLHFGKTAVFHEGLRRFKIGWGALEEEVSYYQYHLREKRFLQAQLNESGWYNRVFRALPLGVSRILGTLLYRHVA